MVRGRKPKPTPLRLLEGNREHRTIHEELEPRPEKKAPVCPAVLKGEERKAWWYLVRELEKMNTLASSDRGTMTSYCHWWGSLVKAKKKMLDLAVAAGDGKDPEVIKTSSGNYIQNPWLSMANTAAKELAKVGALLGLDPTARTRIELDTPNAPRSKKDALLA